MQSALRQAARLLGQARQVMALTGAGMSVASGIPDFRSPGGLWERHDPMEVATVTALPRNPRRVWEFLIDALASLGQAKPNPGHFALARLEREGRLSAVVTQNIDGLHQAAGSREVVEYHGGVNRFYCMGCGREYDPALARGLTERDIPWLCRDCGGVVRPDIVFFGEAIPLDALRKSGQLALAADCMLGAGTSGEVAPANRFPQEIKARGGMVVEINLSESTFSDLADVRIAAPVEDALPALAELVLSQPVTNPTGE
jgi:NAD-dependent deacetylase